MSSTAVNVVLVHGAFVDGSGWQGVHDLLTRDGYRVSVAQNPTVTLDGDAEAVRRILDVQDGPTVLVGHSYGGAVISEAGTHPKVSALVYVTAFAPDKDESVQTLIPEPAPGSPPPPIVPVSEGFLAIERDAFHGAFAGDLPAGQAAFMADSQVPWGFGAAGGVVTEPAWRVKPTWYLIATEDRTIPPPLQRFMAERAGATVTEATGSHAVYISQPHAVAEVIKQAAAG